jgi:BirA family transcriptional regulator, biotin operon repressor / biotin---[acetyl-CoA-carboxylase] ligase
VTLGQPRVHLRLVDSTNAHVRELAGRGAPHGTLVTAREQTAGRGRQGRTWSAAPGRGLLCSVLIREPPRLLPLIAGVAVAEVAEAAAPGGPPAKLKWPNDVHLEGRKVAGILVEGRPQERWAAVGIGLNVALREQDFPPELRASAGTLGLEPDAIETILTRLMGALDRWLRVEAEAVLNAVRARDALLGQRVRWASGEGEGAGIDGDGRLVVRTAAGRVALNAGEVHLAGTRS